MPLSLSPANLSLKTHLLLRDSSLHYLSCLSLSTLPLISATLPPFSLRPHPLSLASNLRRPQLHHSFSLAPLYLSLTFNLCCNSSLQYIPQNPSSAAYPATAPSAPMLVELVSLSLSLLLYLAPHILWFWRPFGWLCLWFWVIVNCVCDFGWLFSGKKVLITWLYFCILHVQQNTRLYDNLRVWVMISFILI